MTAAARCPACDGPRGDGTECPRCGVIYQRWRAHRATAGSMPAGTPPPATARPTPAPAGPRRRPLALATRRALLRELGEMGAAGVPWPQALATLAHAWRDPLRLQVLAKLRAQLEEGSGLADALAGCAFAPTEVALVRAAEQTGQVASALQQLALRLERVQAREAALRAGWLMPALWLVATAILLPASDALSGGIERWLFGALRNVGLLALALVAGAALRAWLAGDPRRLAHAAAVAAQIPGLSGWLRARRLQTLFETLAPALAAGIALDGALGLAGAATGDAATAAILRGVAAEVREHGRLPEAMRAVPGLDDDALGRLAAATASGHLAEAASALAARYEAEEQARGAWVVAAARAVIVLVILAVTAASTAGSMAEVIGDPMRGLHGAEGGELQRELERALPSLLQPSP